MQKKERKFGSYQGSLIDQKKEMIIVIVCVDVYFSVEDSFETEIENKC